jgi:type II secretion system protein C
MSRLDPYNRASRGANPKRTWLGRALVVVAFAGAGFVTLWVAGFDPSGLLSARDHQQLPAPSAPARSEPAPPADGSMPVDPSIAFPGIESSLSDVPRRLILTGTVVGRNVHEGTAFIGVEERNPQTYEAGALLANGARLTEIHADFVVLERDGKTARLYSQEVTSHYSGKAQPPDLLMVGAPADFEPAVATTSEQLTAFIRPSPAYQGELLTGYEVYPGVRAGVFTQMGLRAGDLITAISDTPLTDPQQAAEMFRQLTTGVALVATIRRKDKIERVTLDGALITADLERTRNPPPVAAREGPLM